MNRHRNATTTTANNNRNNRNNRNRPPTSLADVLADPDTEWSDIRRAMKAQGRGSVIVGTSGSGGGGKLMGATTNAGIVKALRDSVGHHNDAKNWSSNDNDDDDVVVSSRTAADSSNNVDWGRIAKSNECAVSSDGDDEDDDGGGDGGAARLKQTLDQLYGGCNNNRRSNDIATTIIQRRKKLITTQTTTNPPPPSKALSGCNDNSIIVCDTAAAAHLRHHHDSTICSSSAADRRQTTKSNLTEKDEKGQQQQSILPVRRLTRTKGETFRGSLTNVLEDKEADMDSANAYEDTLVDTTAGEQSRRPSYAAPPRCSVPMKGATPFRRKSMESIQAYTSNSSFSSASCQSGMHNESINIMDFGHSHRFTESMLSLGDESSNGSLKESMSNLVDSDGFLSWGKDAGSTSSNSLRKNERGPSKRLGSFSDSTLSNLVDSQGFLGWESQMGDLLSQDLAASPEAIEDEAKSGNNDHNAAQDNRDSNNTESSKDLHESWRIEDYENANDTITADPDDEPPKRSGSANILSQKMKFFSTIVTEGISAKRPSWSINADDNNAPQQEVVKTNVIKNILLKGHSMDEPMPKEKNAAAGSRRRNSAFKSFFINKGPSEDTILIPSSSDHDIPNGDCFDSRPAIRVNRKDGIDIGELRRELLHEAAENNEGKNNNGVRRRNMSFF